MKDLFRREPAGAIGLVVSVLLVVQEAVAGAPSWKAALPALVGLLIRRFVSPVGVV